MFWTRADGVGQPQLLTESKNSQIPLSLTRDGTLAYSELTPGGNSEIRTLHLEFGTSIKAAVTALLGTEHSGGLSRELLDIINEGADRLNQLAAEVVSMARIEAGKLHLEKRPVAVEELISSALAELGAARRGREIPVDVPAGLPPADADFELAREVVKHFVENAVKYSPEDTPVRVTAALKNGKIVIGVADYGPGIEENERPLIFDKFFRGRRHRFSTKGTGMGLAIAKGIAEAHGERIWVESEAGQGAAFYLSLAPAGGEEH